MSFIAGVVLVSFCCVCDSSIEHGANALKFAFFHGAGEGRKFTKTWCFHPDRVNNPPGHGLVSDFWQSLVMLAM